jgi:cardiolipin synthase
MGLMEKGHLMPLAKMFADMLTLSRLIIFGGILWLGLEDGSSRLPAAITLLILSWTTDALDGPLARRSQGQVSTWLGDHDLEVDMVVSIGVLVFLLRSGFVEALIVSVYVFLWALIFWRYGNYRSLGMLFQAPIYTWFIVISMREAPSVGVWMLVWIALAVLITWPRFPREVIPGFLSGMRGIVTRKAIRRP